MMLTLAWQRSLHGDEGQGVGLLMGAVESGFTPEKQGTKPVITCIMAVNPHSHHLLVVEGHYSHFAMVSTLKQEAAQLTDWALLNVI